MKLIRPVDRFFENTLYKSVIREAQLEAKHARPAIPYRHAVFDALYNITSTLGLIGQSQIYLNGFPRTRYQRHGIARDGWIRYHYSLYVVSLVGLYDMALLLVNAVYTLGLKPVCCNPAAVQENTRISASVATALRRLRHASQQHREVRNRILHRGEAPELNELSDMPFLELMISAGMETVDHGVMTTRYRAISRKLLDRINGETEGHVDELNRLCNALDLEFQLRQAEYLLLPTTGGKTLPRRPSP